MITKKKSRFMSLILAVLVFGLLVTPAPIAHANGSTQESQSQGSVNDVSVSMGTDGKLTIQGISDGDSASTWNTIFNQGKVFIIGFSGIGMLVFIAFFIKNFLALGASANNPTARSQALTGCLWTGVAAACCGAVTILVGLFWNAFK